MNSRLTRNVSSGQAIDGVLLHIPEYQRPYKWTVKNANLLLSDILEAMNEKHQVYRVGTLILHKNNKFYDIVDGQQRIITFLLLLHAFSIHSNLQKFRLSDSPVTRYNLQQNYYSLKRQVDNISDIQKKELNDYIMHHCELIVVITYELSEAFQFFDSQNARGKSLYPHDLLKAYHLREMSGFKESEIESTVCSWESMDQNLLYRLFGDYLYRIKQWLYDRRAYELNDQNLDIFKGITKTQNEPYAQFYKRAIDSSNERLFLLEAPIVAGKPFFDYSKHYYGQIVKTGCIPHPASTFLRTTDYGRFRLRLQRLSFGSVMPASKLAVATLALRTTLQRPCQLRRFRRCGKRPGRRRGLRTCR